MAFLSSMDICASGMTAQRLRLDIAAENITNRRRRTLSEKIRSIP